MNYSFNFGDYNAPLALGLRTEEVEKIVPLITQQAITGKLIREMASQGALEVRYPLGSLDIRPSVEEKVNGRWRWDIWIKPTAVHFLGK
ncbi:hypothetical protein XM38_026620 [Halomicronema hongdechloris C2206]|uniref:Uncharacterized protein n=1 Tax=Halomicronema hongdechloris C2206 TaxID=1641165 RepID=A0A1Z3HN22_9CYAN|nr:hypothetical protein [Halomicronema hongdechloris]ASC71708.1 hypothetical protein XM38_026620 [Halomicronema hongdechloris C2206]